MAIRNPRISKITPNVNGLNSPIKSNRVVGWIKKQNPSMCCTWEIHLSGKSKNRCKVNGSSREQWLQPYLHPTKQTLSQEDIQVVDGYMKRCSKSLARRKTKIRTAVRYHFAPVRTAVINKARNGSCGTGCGAKRFTAGGSAHWCRQFGGSS